jgi:Zn-dependent peptidase ImmA (M78 family)/transcriptional regulator with XRE-family HTH domain
MDMVRMIGTKIDELRKQSGLSQENLAAILGVTRPTMVRYLKGEQAIDSAKLLKLAHYFHCPVQYFFEDQTDSLSFMFRADQPSESMDDVLLKKVNRRLLDYVELLKEADGVHDFYIPDAHRITVHNGRKMDTRLKQKVLSIAEEHNRAFQLDTKADIYRVLEDHGIIVYAMKLPQEIFGLSGYSHEFGAFIVINDSPDISEERKRFSCAHELGHLVMHRDEYSLSAHDLKYRSSRTDPRERMADYFASCLLIPRGPLRQVYDEVVGSRQWINLEDIYLLKKHFGVSAMAIAMALKEQRLITDKTFGYFRKQLNERFGNSEPEPMNLIHKNKKLTHLLRNLAIKGEIGTKKVAELLDIPLSEARSLIKKWTKPKPRRGEPFGEHIAAESVEEYLW